MSVDLFKVGLALFIAGFTLALIATLAAAIFPALQAEGGPTGVSSGGCILIMFVPICFGVGEAALPLMVLAVGLAVVLLIVSLVLLSGIRRTLREIGV
ncbi:MAG: hypothetical protein RMI56_02070 [Sulfolobales archaeon]|nr:hypothetical protein [Sulfolobales archaeon]MDW8082563.1 hypothetical protein [Sulfolobales archaeon]